MAVPDSIDERLAVRPDIAEGRIILNRKQQESSCSTSHLTSCRNPLILDRASIDINQSRRGKHIAACQDLDLCSDPSLRRIFSQSALP